MAPGFGTKVQGGIKLGEGARRPPVLARGVASFRRHLCAPPRPRALTPGLGAVGSRARRRERARPGLSRF